MIKKISAVVAWIEFVQVYKREPEKDEFMEMGFSRATYYRIKKQMREGGDE
jgi:hypothetical protein